MSEHSKLLPPSGAGIWIPCGGSSHAQLHMPDLFSLPAEEGTAVHMCSEACFRLNCRAASFIGSEFNNIEITEEMAEHIQDYINAVKQTPHDPGFLYVEKRGSLPNVHKQLYGTLDNGAYFSSQELVTLRDLKYGRENVTVVGNAQLWIYTLMLINFLESLGKKVKYASLWIEQPRTMVGETRENQLIDVKQIKEWGRDVLTPAAKAAVDPTSPRTPGGHCKHCKAKITCPEYLSWCNYSVEPPHPLTNETIGSIIQRKSSVKNLIEQAEHYGVERLSRGMTVPGCKLVKSIKHRAVKSPELTAHKLLELGATREQIYTNKLKKPKGLLESLDSETFGKVLDEHIFKPPGDRKIALLNDNRPAVASSKEIFNNG